MGTSAGPTHKQDESSSQPVQAMSATDEPTIQMIESWNTNQLLDWIQQNLILPLDNEDKELFLKAKIDGEAFLGVAGNLDFFNVRVGLAPGVSQKLAQLAKDTMGRKSKWFRLHHTRYADKRHRLHHARHADVHCPRWLRHTATPDICTLHFHFYRS